MKIVFDKNRNTCRGFYENPYMYALTLCLVLALYFLQSYINIQDLDYIAINGYFQNYNSIRRFLDGQIPFVDFTVYLGCGHLILTSAFTALLGGKFAASYLAYDYISSLTVLIYCYGFSYILFRKNWIIPFYTAIYFRMIDRINLSYYSIEAMMIGGNSARMIRAMIVPLCILIYAYVSNWFENHQEWSEKRQFYSHIILISIMSGIGFLWGNDFGLVSCIALFLIVLFLTAIRYRSIQRFGGTLVIMILGCLFTIISISALVTHGHPLIWFERNFISANYQGWYYESPLNHTFFYYELDYSLPIVVSIILIIVNSVLILQNITWQNIRYFGSVIFALMTCFGAAQEYRLFSSVDAKYNIFLIGTLHILFVCEIIHMVIWIWEKFLKNKIMKIPVVFHIFLYIICFYAVIVVCIYTVALLPKEQSQKKYYPVLGGHLLTCSDDLDRSLEIVGNKRVFSLYASALETVTGQYQPSGTDYVIHVLSDDQRTQYLNVLSARDFDMVSTVNPYYHTYSLWIRSANWFVYREIYSDYHYVGSNNYADYWEYGSSSDNCYSGEITLEIVRESEHDIVIHITTPEAINGIADVYIDYASSTLSDADTFLLHRTVVGADDLTDHRGFITEWTLRPANSEYIPIEIVNGEGSLRLTSYPVDITMIELNDISCERIFIDSYLP